jgi:hypothetical protein
VGAHINIEPTALGGPHSSTSLWQRACLGAALTLLVLALVTIALPGFNKYPLEGLSALLAVTQDLPVVPVLLLIWILARRCAIAGAPPEPPLRPALWIAGSIALILLVGWAGHYVVFSGYDLSRDEQMASFDAAIFRSGQLFSPIPAAWRPFADALNLRFILPIGAREFWVSSYLPLHAAWRAAFSYFADPALASPVMAALGAFCIWRVSRLLWPASASTQIVAVLLYAFSSQVLVTAMTAFSMSMHLALNMLWLWLFLLDRRRTHAAAMAVGWVATGIHQPLFHPLFVLPFLFLLAGQKRWKLLAAYLLAYALIAAFWLAWPLWISAHGSAPAVAISDHSGIGFFERLRAVFNAHHINGLWLTAANLLRFICWQHPLLVPLAIVGVWSNFREQALCRALSIGFVLPILFMAILLPWQGHGWGYRYVHPVLGNAILLGAYGWQTLEARGINLRGAAVISSALALLVLFPVHAVMAHRLASPFAKVESEFASADTDILIVDTQAAPFAEDLVLNRPDLSNRPKILIARFLKPSDMASLCKLGSVEFVPAAQLAPLRRAFGISLPPRPTSEMARLVAEARRVGCRGKDL